MDAVVPTGPAHRPGVEHGPAVRVVVALDVAAKAALVFFLVLVLMDPAWGNLEGKSPVARAVTYPMLAFLIPVVWVSRPRTSTYPWVADLLVTLTCFTDILGNRLNLYDSVEWFDDAVHFVANGLLGAAVILLSLDRRSTLHAMIERALAVGLTASLAWELFEYVSFVTQSPELATAYSDTLWDLMLGWWGAVFAAVVVHAVWTWTGAGGTRSRSVVATAWPRG